MPLKSITLYWIILTVTLFTNLQAQSLTLKMPVEQTVYLSEYWSIALSVDNINQHVLTMEGQPPSAVLKGNIFSWTPQPQEHKQYSIHFKLLDSNRVIKDEVTLVLQVKEHRINPSISFDKPLPDTIPVIENQLYSLTGNLKSASQNGTSLSTYFLFNEDPNVRNFDSCRIDVNGDQLILHWTPSNKEALKEYAKLRITLMQGEQAMYSKVLIFKIKNINQSPYFTSTVADTLYYAPSQGLRINCAAKDPDQDKLTYDFSPKLNGYELQGTDLIVKPGTFNDGQPVPLFISVSDHAQIAKRKIVLIPQAENARIDNHSFQPLIGDFTKKVFLEGDSVVTFLNVSSDIDLATINITYSDLDLPAGINSITKYLIFEKEPSYIKVYSKGRLPYSLVDHDYNYNITVCLTSKVDKKKSCLRVLVLTVENKPDPQTLMQQKDSLLNLVKLDLVKEEVYKNSLVKIRNRIHKPWWKKIAIVTGTVSGALTLIQIENPNKTISLVSASISLLSIIVTNIPNFSEKTLSLLDDKIANSKSRMESLRKKEYEFLYNWSLNMDQNSFDKIRNDLEELLHKNTSARETEVCYLLRNRKVVRKLRSLIKHPAGLDKQSLDLNDLFKCHSIK